MKSKLILSIATLAALALPAVAAENNFRDRDRDRDRNNNVTVCGIDTCMRVFDKDGYRFVDGDKYRNHSVLVDRDNIYRGDHLGRARFDRDRDRDRDDVRR